MANAGSGNSGADASVWDVVVVPYDAAWPHVFEQEAAAIRQACGENIVAVKHVGSTAVAGLVAKPIIDIELLVASFQAGAALVPVLESNGYIIDSQSPIPEWHSLWRPATPERLQVNLAMHAPDHPDGLRRIAFRDYLRSHPEAAAAYGSLKRALAARYAHDGSAYTGGKTGFIRRVRREIAGLGPETISVVDYNPEWPAMFEADAQHIRAVVGDQLLALEHIGSTSVPGLPAKPMIDIMATIASYEEGRHLVIPLRRIGYLYYGENEIPRRHYFDLEDAGGHDVVHLHVLEQDSSDASNHLLFRDYLRSHPETRAEYAALKRDLIARYATNRRLYTAEKADFIQGVLAATSIQNRQSAI